MAATLTHDNELTYVSFPLDKSKTEVNADGDVIVYGKATDGTVDTDDQIVDAVWAAKAIKDWFDSGANIRVQHQPQRDPAGKGIEVTADGHGGQWLKALIVEPVAKQLVLKGILQAWSVGIMRPTILPDQLARNGRIAGGELGEISLVDRPANKNCRLELVKAAKDGHAEWIGEMSGDRDFLAKSIDGDILNKVGPKGYEHNWVFIGVPGSKDVKDGVKDAETGAKDVKGDAKTDGKAVEHDAKAADHVVTGQRKPKDLTNRELKETDAELTRRAKTMGQGDKVSPTHKKVKDEIARRKANAKDDGNAKDDAKQGGDGGDGGGDSGGGGGGAGGALGGAAGALGGLAGMLGGAMGGSGGGAHGAVGAVGHSVPSYSVVNNLDEAGKPGFTGTISAAVRNKTAVKGKIDPSVGGGVDRNKIPAGDFAGEDRSFPIVTPGDVPDAAQSVGRARGQSKQKIKRRIKQIAERKGPEFVAALPDSLKGNDMENDNQTATETVVKGKPTCPSCHGYVDDGDAKCGKCGHELNGSGDDDAAKMSSGKGHGGKPDDNAYDPDRAGNDGSSSNDDEGDAGDDGADSMDEDDDNADKTAAVTVVKGRKTCPKCSAMGKGKAAFCSKCGASMAPPAIAKGLVTAGRSEPTPADGVTGESASSVPAHREPDGSAIEAFEADAKIPTDPDSAMKAAHRLASSSAPDDLGLIHDLTCPAFSHQAIKSAYPVADLNTHLDVSAWQLKALDAAAGGTMEEAAQATKNWQSATTIANVDPAMVIELRKEAFKTFQDANPGVSTFPTPSSITPGSFKRPYLAAGHARPSFQYAGPNTAPMVSGQITAEQYDRGPLTTGQAANSPANKGVQRTFYTNAQRDNAVEAMRNMHDHISHVFPDLCPMGDSHPGDGDGGSVTTGPVNADPVGKAKASKVKQLIVPAPLPVTTEVNKAAAGGGLSVPDLIKSAVAEATNGLAERLAETEALLKVQRRDAKRLAKQIDHLNGLADPSVSPWKGMAFPTAITKSLGAGRTETPEDLRAFSQRILQEDLAEQAYNHADPRMREAARGELMRLRGIAS